jgi:hypothetical protein
LTKAVFLSCNPHIYTTITLTLYLPLFTRSCPSSFAAAAVVAVWAYPHTITPHAAAEQRELYPVLSVPQRARPLFESLRGLCVGVPSTSLPPHRPRQFCPFRSPILLTMRVPFLLTKYALDRNRIMKYLVVPTIVYYAFTLYQT